MTQPTLFDQPIQVMVHRVERTKESEVILNSKREKLGGNCRKILTYWMRNNIWLSDDNCRRWLDVRNLAQRVADLRHVMGIAIESRIVDRNYKEYRLKCTCKLIGGNDVKEGCYVHDEKLIVA